MARTTITPQTRPGERDYDGLALTMTAADTANQNQSEWSPGIYLVAHNTGASQHNVTVTGSADALGRSSDLTNTIEADEIMILGPFHTQAGWGQVDGMLYFEADNLEVEYASVSVG